MHVWKYILLPEIISSMKDIKTAESNRLTDRHLTNFLKIKNAFFDANIKKNYDWKTKSKVSLN